MNVQLQLKSYMPLTIKHTLMDYFVTLQLIVWIISLQKLNFYGIQHKNEQHDDMVEMESNQHKLNYYIYSRVP